MKVSRHSFPQDFEILPPPARRGARKNGRVPNETMTCHGWDGNPSFCKCLVWHSDPLFFFPRGMFLGCFKMFPGQPMQGRFHLAPMTGFKASSFWRVSFLLFFAYLGLTKLLSMDVALHGIPDCIAVPKSRQSWVLVEKGLQYCLFVFQQIHWLQIPQEKLFWWSFSLTHLLFKVF